MSRMSRIFPDMLTGSGRAKVRQSLARRMILWAPAVFHVAAGRYAGVLPRGVTGSIPEIMVNATSCANVLGVSCVRSASVERYEHSGDLPPAFRREAAFPARYVYTMRDVIVGVPSGVCLSSERVFLESFGNAYKWFAGSAPVETALRRCRSAAPMAGPSTCLGSATYYHFLLEEVPRLLYALAERPDLSVLTHADAPRHVVSLVALLREKGIIRGSLVKLPLGLYRVNDYVFTSAELDSGFVHSQSIHLLRSVLGPGATPEVPLPLNPSSKIYVSRRRDRRALTNEADIESMLVCRGFRVVYLEDLEVGDQIALFQQVDTVVGTHGAGLANLVWVRPGTRVVEVFSPRYFNDCFARLAVTVGAEYRELWAESDGGWGSLAIGSLTAALD